VKYPGFPGRAAQVGDGVGQAATVHFVRIGGDVALREYLGVAGCVDRSDHRAVAFDSCATLVVSREQIQRAAGAAARQQVASTGTNRVLDPMYLITELSPVRAVGPATTVPPGARDGDAQNA